jgi:putative peptidoglycan lipid II flippase
MIKRESLRRGSISTSILNIFGRVIGFISIFLISYLFGANNDTDIFYFLLSFTALVTTLFTNLYSSVFLPLFIKVREQRSNKEAWIFLNSLFTYTVFFAIFLGGLYCLWAVRIVDYFSQFNSKTLTLSQDLLVLFAPVITLMILVEFLKTVIQSQYQFTLPALSVVFNNVINILLLISLGKIFGIKVMAVSVVISYALQFVFLMRYIKKHELLFKFSLKYTKDHTVFFRVSTPVVLTQLFSIAAMFYYDYSATMFSAGTLTSIAIAIRIFSLPNDMVIAPLSNVIAPVLSENAACKDFKKFNENFLKYNNTIWMVVIPISFFFMFFSDDIVRLLFLRGKFTIQDAHVSSITLKLLAFSLFGLSFNAISTRALFALQKATVLSISSLIVSLASIAVTYFAVEMFGYAGIAAARTAAVVVLCVGSLLFLLKQFMPEFSLVKTFFPMLKMTLAAVVSSFISYFLFNKITSLKLLDSTFSNDILAYFFSLPVFFIIYSYSCYFFKITEFVQVFSFLKEKMASYNLKFLKA